MVVLGNHDMIIQELAVEQGSLQRVCRKGRIPVIPLLMVGTS